MEIFAYVSKDMQGLMVPVDFVQPTLFLMLTETIAIVETVQFSILTQPDVYRQFNAQPMQQLSFKTVYSDADATQTSFQAEIDVFSVLLQHYGTQLLQVATVQ